MEVSNEVGWRRKQAGLVHTYSSFVHHKKHGLLKTLMPSTKSPELPLLADECVRENMQLAIMIICGERFLCLIVPCIPASWIFIFFLM